MICFVFKPRFVPSVYAVLLASRGKGTPTGKCSQCSRALCAELRAHSRACAAWREGLKSTRLLHSSVGFGLRP